MESTTILVLAAVLVATDAFEVGDSKDEEWGDTLNNLVDDDLSAAIACS
jgi:hypothetical protein